MTDKHLEEVDTLLAGVVAQAARLHEAEDPGHELKELLRPVRDLVARLLAGREHLIATAAVTAGSTAELAPREKVLVMQGEAATRIQALVRGKHQRGLVRQHLSFRLQGTKVLKKYVLKRDRFPNCHVLDTPGGDHAPNFRRLPDTPLYGSAQPTLEGIKQIMQRVSDDGFSKVVWVNLREEAVIYVDGTPFTARRSAKLNENDLVPGITGHTVQVLEASMKASLQEQLADGNNRFQYWHELVLHENELVTAENVDPNTIYTLSDIFDTGSSHQTNPQIKDVTYYRIPIERENAPEHGDVEQIMDLIRASLSTDDREATSETAFIFNCQMGKRRTTTAMVIGSLIWEHLHDNKVPKNELAEEQEEHGAIVKDRDGDFAVIRELKKVLPLGKQAKTWVDATIDMCSSICNLRAIIHEYHELSNSEAKPAKRSYYLHHALSFLERYFYLIVFGTYLFEIAEQGRHVDGCIQEGQSESTSLSFSRWLQQHPNLFRLLDDLGGVKYKYDKVLEKAVLKFDHFPGLARIPFELSSNVPNFRQIAQEPIFGSAQCLEAGIEEIASHCAENGFQRVICINLREEAVVYVTGRPFVVRHAENLTNNVEYPGIEVSEIVAMEQQVKREVQTRVRRANGLFMYWHEPREFVNEEKIEHIDAESEVKTLHQIYTETAERTGFDIRYARIPVSDETAPEEKDFDDLVRLLLPAFCEDFGLSATSTGVTAGSSTPQQPRTAVVCNCQMGRGRTTTALICTYMLRVVMEAVSKKPKDQDDGSTNASESGGALREIMEEVDAPRSSHRQSISSQGDFVVIRKLCETLENGGRAKTLVDVAVDKCEHLQNLRECIAQCRDLAVDRELSSSQHDYYMRRAVNYLERYFYIICFASYLLEEREYLFKRQLFVTWMNTRYGSALYALLDNLCFAEEVDTEVHTSSMRWRWRRKRKLISRLE